jgi:hypothetical protein
MGVDEHTGPIIPRISVVHRAEDFKARPGDFLLPSRKLRILGTGHAETGCMGERCPLARHNKNRPLSGYPIRVDQSPRRARSAMTPL